MNQPKYLYRALILFNMGSPIGTGLAYLISLVAKDINPNDWRLSMRFTPFLLAFILVIILLCFVDPRVDSRSTNNNEPKTNFFDDVKALIKNKTYVLLLFSWTAGLASLGILYVLQIKLNRYTI